MSLLDHVPTFGTETAESFAQKLYRLNVQARELPSERDQNFLLTSAAGEKYVLKIANGLEQRDLLEAQNAVLNHLQSRVSFCPRLVCTETGESIPQVFKENVSYNVRLVTYLPGEPLATVHHSIQLLFDFGKQLGSITRALADFDHTSFHRQFHWDLANGSKIIHEYIGLVADESFRKELQRSVLVIEQALVQRLPRLPRSVIHGDANDHNVIVKDDKVVGLIDFGDMIYSYTAGELAVALAYVLLDKPDPLASAGEVVAGYVSEWPLNDDELAAVWWLMLKRLCMSVCLAAYQQRQKPDNAYLDISQRSIRDTLPVLLSIDPYQVADVFGLSQ